MEDIITQEEGMPAQNPKRVERLHEIGERTNVKLGSPLNI